MSDPVTSPSPPPVLLPRSATSRADAAFACVVVGLVMLTGALYTLFPGIMAVFLLSTLLAYALTPIVDGLEQKGLSRTLGVMLGASAARAYSRPWARY